jgi:hypothetical protein
MAALEQIRLAQPALVALLQEEFMPVPAVEPDAEESAPEVLEAPPAEQPSLSEVPIPSAEPAQPAAAPGPSDPTPAASDSAPAGGAPAPAGGAPIATPTMDIARAVDLDAPAVQTAIATLVAPFSGLERMVPGIVGQEGQTNQSAPPALQTAAAATMSALTGR